jgi:hypothetical protein
MSAGTDLGSVIRRMERAAAARVSAEAHAAAHPGPAATARLDAAQAAERDAELAIYGDTAASRDEPEAAL